jgi:hypothetical protein
MGPIGAAYRAIFAAWLRANGFSRDFPVGAKRQKDGDDARALDVSKNRTRTMRAAIDP